jgi:hypothetical protein
MSKYRTPPRLSTATSTRRIAIELGKVVYEAGAPKNLPKWYWRCQCGCGTFNAPFRTMREAETDAVATALRSAEIAYAEEEGRNSIHH